VALSAGSHGVQETSLRNCPGCDFQCTIGSPSDSGASVGMWYVNRACAAEARAVDH
jgi:hypothetical protein